MHCNAKEIMKHMPARTMIENYQSALVQVQQAFELLITAKKRLSAAFGTYYDNVLPQGVSDYNLERELKTAVDMIRRNAWKGVIEKTQIKKLISSHRRNQLEDQLKKGQLPELDHQTLADMLADLGGNVDRYFNEAVQEVFEWLRPRRSAYKTNTEFEIGKKVIISYAVDTYCSVTFNYHKEQNFSSLDNVFHLLDGKGVSKYPDDAITKIREAIRQGAWACETAYFYFKWFKNGNMHITFKHLDLVRELNRIGGGNKVKS